LNLFGFNISRAKVIESLSLTKAAPSSLQSVSSASWMNNWFGPVLESFTGAWQRNITVDPQTSLLAFSAVFACVTGIAGDIAKMRIKLDRDEEGIWTEITEPHGNSVESRALPVLKKPNRYQTRIKFIEQWIVSKLLYGNAYILKERDNLRGPITALYVLNSQRVTPLVADDGSVWYKISPDYLSGVDEEITVPASEVIHDTMVCLWHPLVGVSPIYACGVSATMGNKIQNNSTSLFGNLSRPGGVVMFPSPITNDQAKEFKERWEAGFGGANIGRTAILDNGSKFEALAMPAVEAQLIEQLKWTVEDVARAFHYPLFKLGGALPPYASSPDALTTMYYTDCLQGLIESLEICLDEGLELPLGLGTELDLDNLMRMDTAALYDANNKAVGGGWMAPDEARFRANYKKVAGGSSPMIQQQNYSLAALAKRDAQADPFATKPTIPVQPSPQPETPVTPTKSFVTEEECEAQWDDAFEQEPITV
jgi:HK97 family phage portal protein